jgi:flavin-dependent dehydrogenase
MLGCTMSLWWAEASWLYAADRLARYGWSVAVFEEHAEIGLPVHCTGLLALMPFLDLPFLGADLARQVRPDSTPHRITKLRIRPCYRDGRY